MVMMTLMKKMCWMVLSVICLVEVNSTASVDTFVAIAMNQMIVRIQTIHQMIIRYV